MNDAAYGIEHANINRWFDTHIGPVGELRFTPVEGGHSCLTYIVDTEIGERYVLRRPPMGDVLATAHDVLREHRVVSALASTSVPVAPVVGRCADPDVTGAPFYVMQFVEGTVLHDRSAAEALPVASRRRAGHAMIDVLVALQAVDPDTVGLGTFAKRTDFLGRQLRRWHAQWKSSETPLLPQMTELHDWLVANQPVEGPSVIVHGDFRLGNAIHRGNGTIAALLDWELCTLGPRDADLSYLLRSWADPTTKDDSDVASAADGFPDRRALIYRYERTSGNEAGDLDYWTAFHAWRSACIVAGVYTRYKTGQMGEPGGDIQHFEDSVFSGLQAGLAAARIQ